MKSGKTPFAPTHNRVIIPFMYRTAFIMIAVFAILFSLPQSGFAQDEVSPDAGVPESADAGEPEPAEAEEPEPAEAEEPVLEEPFVPDVELEDDDDYGYEDDALQEALDDLPDGKPFAKGDIELGLGLGGYGSGDYFQLTIGGAFAYYVVNRLAPGIDLSYLTTFLPYQQPQDAARWSDGFRKAGIPH